MFLKIYLKITYFFIVLFATTHSIILKNIKIVIFGIVKFINYIFLS
jgi:hypothetical protein